MNIEDLNWLNNESVVNTFFLFVVVLLIRIVIVRIIKGRTPTLSDNRRRWLSIVQNSSFLLGLLGLIYIWSPQLSTFALSLTAFAVALVIATKEYLLCVMGALYRATSSAFSVGDWIEVHGLRGEVLTEGILSTRLQELDGDGGRNDYTGRILVVPNSIFLTQTVFNESYRKRYLHHRFRVTVEPGIDPTPIVAQVRDRLPELCPETDQTAERYWSMVRQRLQKEIPSREAQVSLDTSELGKIRFTVTVFCAVSKASAIEADITGLVLRAAAQASAQMQAG
ncbi:mechanosensitive ion channel family protein [Algimonas porphyrae]|uniref:Mechanosensitive ion channel protein MscS n=2 Tax=Algimonas porphyrae TaxID=1128113 RepID=A0ABQ5V2F7_9PROT|nr:mechanosensitive ion channel protein MscS [Algimonas porphyrae]